MSDKYDEIAKKLEEYRKKKPNTKPTEKDKEIKETLLLKEDSNDLSVCEETESEVDYTEQPLSLLDYVYFGLCFILWITLYAIFIKLQFGTVFFLISSLVFIYINTRTRPKKKGEISAYSVFNKDCKSIDGTLKAEQFEREIRYGSGAVH